MIYGNPPVRSEDDTTDLIGVRTLVLSQMWQPQGADLTQAQIDAQQPGIPAVSGGLLLVGQQNRPFGGAYKCSWTFDGINGDGKSVTFKDRSNSIDYSFEPSLTQVPIQLHPLFQQLLAQYGGFQDPSSGQVVWPINSPATNTGSNGLPGNSTASTATNPMFGHQDFQSYEGVYRFRYAELSLPSSLLQGVNPSSAV